MSKAKQKVLDKAEALFHQHGYSSISMRDIASALDMQKASLYYHAPQGKEQLYVEVTERMFQRHNQGLKKAIKSGEDITDQLYRIARWIFSQPPMFLFKMMDGDMPALSAENAQHLRNQAYQLLFNPLVAMFQSGIDSGQIRPMVAEQLTGTFLTLMEGVAFAKRHKVGGKAPIENMVDDALDLMIYGIRPRAVS